MFNSGFIPSVIDGTENEFIEPKNKGLLKEYSYKKYLPDVLNQGRDSICVPCSLSVVGEEGIDCQGVYCLRRVCL